MDECHPRLPAIVERDAELRHLDAALAAVHDGTGRLVVLEGPPGIGKSTLLAATARLADDQGFQVLSARGHPIESDLSFGLARQLLERTVWAMPEEERAAALGGAASLATSVIGSEPSLEESIFPAMHGLYWLAANLADRRPLLILVDDAQWADAASLRWLTYLTQRLEDVRALVVVARWPSTVGPATPLLDVLSSDRAADRIVLSELTREGVGLLAGELTGSPIAPAELAGLYERTGGNPFFVREVLLAQGAGPTDAVPPAVGRYASTRMGGLSADARRLAAAAAVLGHATTVSLGAAVAGLTTAAAEVARDELARSGIIAADAGLAFVHPIVREALYSDLGAGDRAGLHKRAASVLADRDADIERQAIHLLSSTPDADAATVGVLVEAAARARSRGDHQTASAYLDRARQEGGPRAAQETLLLELGATLSLWNPAAALEPLESALQAAPDADARLSISAELAQTRSRLADLIGAYDVLERALEDGPIPTNTDLRLAAEGGLLTTGGLAPQLVKRSLERLKTVSPPAGDTPGERILLSGIVRVRLTGPDPWDGLIELTRRAIGGGKVVTDTAPDAGTIATVIWPLLISGLFDEADALIEAFFADGARRGSLVNVALATHLHGVSALFRGDINAALEYTERAIELSLSSGYFVIVPTATAFRIRALIQADRVAEADELLGRYGFDGDVPDLAILFHTVLRARAELRLAQGCPEDAMRDLEDLRDRHLRSGIDEESLSWRPLASEAALALGRRTEAIALAEEEVARATRKGVAPAVARAHLALGRSLGGAAGLDCLRTAADSLAPTPFELDRARALAELGRTLIGTNQRTAAREPLLQALEISARLGATALAEAVTRDLRTCGARPRRTAFTGAEALTPSERKVAELAAGGHTNAEIAQRLFVTRKSVEFHLTNAYRKLQVGSRKELTAALG